MEYRLIRSKRKTAAIRIEADGTVTVRAPLHMPQKTVDTFLSQHIRWIETHRAAVLAAAKERFIPKLGETAMLLGEPMPLVSSANSAIAEDHIGIKAGASVAAELAKLYKKAAQDILPPMLEAVAKREGISCSGIKITSAKTRFGSCSGKNGICLSWRIVSAPKELIESVMVHELCHILHHDHSPRFWDEVCRRMPDYDRKKRALNAWARRWFFDEKECSE